jgi:methionine aminopeptidase
MNQPPICYFLKSLEFKRFPDNCSGLAACLNAAIAKIQSSYTPSDKRIEVGDYVKIDIGGGWYVDGIVDHVPCKSSDCWIIIEEDGLPRVLL